MKVYKTLIIILFNVFDIISSTKQTSNPKTNSDTLPNQNSLSKYEIISDLELEQEQIFLNFSLISYGNWCGPSHGGYQDCCNGKSCESCKIEYGKPTKECLEECQPIDQLDYYCAIHDQCCLDSYNNNEFTNVNHIECYPEGNKCYCDCLLIKHSSSLSMNECNSFYCRNYLMGLKYVFENVVSCWYINSENMEVCNKNNKNITGFCNDIE
jgi:hypothetical protein